MKDTKQERALAIFLKNQRLGAVKTRLAAAIGNQRALEIYGRLVALTLKAVKGVSASLHVYYSDSLESVPIDLQAEQHIQMTFLKSAQRLSTRPLKSSIHVT